MRGYFLFAAFLSFSAQSFAAPAADTAKASASTTPASVAKRGPASERIVAIVNDDIITQLELDRAVKLVRQQLRERNTPAPSAAQLTRQVLEREIGKQLQLQMAKGTGIIVDDNALNNAINNIASQNKLPIDEFRNALEKDGYEFAQFREDVRGEMIIARLRQREVTNRISITDQEIANYLATQAAQGNVNDEFRVAHILIGVPEAATTEIIDKVKLKAETLLAELQKGADFKQTAISASDGQHALEGGDLGWRKSGQLPTLFAASLLRMKPGEISPLIRSPSGFHIVKLLEKRAGEQHIVTQTKARHILLRTSELATEVDITTRLQQLRDRIEGGADFAELARSQSEDRNTATNGGDLDWVSPGDLVPQFEGVMSALKPNVISEPFQTPFGWHIVQVLERRQLDNSEEFARNEAREFLRDRKIDEQSELWLRQLRDEAYVELKLDE